MKQIFSVVIGLVATVTAYSQDPVTWIYKSQKISDNTYELHFTATVQSPWHIYSQTLKGEGPVPTTITFQKHPVVTVDKVIKEVGRPVTKYEEVFSMNVKYYEESVDFVAIAKLKSTANTVIKGTIEFMACTNEKCLPPQIIPFSIKL